MTVMVLRPYDSYGDWVSVPSSAPGGLADNSDVTYRVLSNVYQVGIAEIDLGILPWGSGIVSRAIRIRARVKTDGGNNSYVQVLVGTGPAGAKQIIGTGANLQLIASGTSFNEVSTAWHVTNILQSDAKLFLAFQAVGLTDDVWVAEVYLDFDFVYPPLVTTQLPNGTYTSTSAPPFWFTYTSQSEYPQSAYRYFIYNDTQYNASGFQPGVTTPFASNSFRGSGVVMGFGTPNFSTNTRGTLPPLPNDDYRIYVQVAQTIQTGVLQWSPIIGPSSTNIKSFTINVPPPNAPAITATADSTNARIRLAITGTGAANSSRDVYEVERSFDGGTTWEDVRGESEDSYIENIGGARIWYDYETANAQSVVYRARTITLDTAGNTLVGAYSANSASVSWTSTGTWLKIPTAPWYNMQVIIRSFGSEDFGVLSGTFQGVDSDEAVVVSGVRRARPDSTITFLTRTEAELAELHELLATGDTILVHASVRSSGWKNRSRYIKVSDVREQRPTRAGWSELRDVICPFTEIERPDTLAYNVIFGITTWQDVDDTYATFTAWSNSATTYGDLKG